MHVLMIPAERVLSQNRLSPQTYYRLAEGQKRWACGSHSHILVTGGIFHAPSEQTIPAARLMADWLIERGVPEGAIIIEDESLDTYENVIFGIRMLDDREICTKNMTVISHPTHLRRLRLVFKTWSRVMDLVCVPVGYDLGFVGWLKEAGMYLVHRFDPYGKSWLVTRNVRQRRALAAS